MKAYATNLATADGLRKQSEDLRNQSESLMQQARTLYGKSTGQSINTPGTLYLQLDLIKKALLKKYKGNEEELSTYGFDVVIGLSKSPVKKNTQANTPPVKGTENP